MGNIVKSHINSINESEISFVDLIQFFSESWRQILLAGVIGAVLGFAGWFFLGSYKANLKIYNLGNNNKGYGIDLFTWRTLQKNLPKLANQILKNEQIDRDQKNIYLTLSNPQWWIDNVKPEFFFLKSDAKDFPSIFANNDNSSTRIQSFSIFASGQNQQSALNNLSFASQFFINGGSYIMVDSLIKLYDREIIETLSNIRIELAKARNEQNYILDRIKALEALQKRFPSRASNIENLYLQNSKDTNLLKFFSIESQLIAANNDLIQIVENINHLNDRISQMKVLGKFIELAQPKLEAEINGLELVKSLLMIEEDLRKELVSGDNKLFLVLAELRAKLLNIEYQFIKGLEVGSFVNSKKPYLLESIAAGAILSGFLMLVLIILRKYFKNLKSSIDPNNLGGSFR